MIAEEAKDEDLKRLLPCPFCGGGITEFHDNGRVWSGMGYSEPISVSVRHWCAEATEKRLCDECGHKGTDGGSTSESYCGACGATVPYPEEDLCPACGATNCMLIACPECGGHYSLDDEDGDDIETPNA